MPEAGYIPIPKKLALQGVKDIVRISDGRMSGTAYGTVVLHVSPEAAIGGPLALVQNGDIIELDVPGRRLHLEISDAEMARRHALWVAPPLPLRGWQKIYVDGVQQAHLGADLDVLVGSSGADVPRDSH
jgi:dihydroxy-acid dehydratase